MTQELDIMLVDIIDREIEEVCAKFSNNHVDLLYLD